MNEDCAGAEGIEGAETGSPALGGGGTGDVEAAGIPVAGATGVAPGCGGGGV